MTACPSGVQYGPLIEAAKEKLVLEKRTPFAERIFIATLRNFIFPYPKRLRIAVIPARLAQHIPPLARFLTRLPYVGPLMNMLPPTKPAPRLMVVTPAVGNEKYKVALLTGCVGEAMFQHVNAATVRVLARNGCRVIIPRGQVCCGAMHATLGLWKARGDWRAVTSQHSNKL
jgi:glycolate oxidase iron-sulfur subunit